MTTTSVILETLLIEDPSLGASSNLSVLDTSQERAGMKVVFTME